MCCWHLELGVAAAARRCRGSSLQGRCSYVASSTWAGQGSLLLCCFPSPALFSGKHGQCFLADKWRVQARTWFFFIEVPVDELAAFLPRKVSKRLFTHSDIFTAFITQLHPGVFRLFMLWFTGRFQELGSCPVLCSSAACWINLSGKHGCQSWTIPCNYRVFLFLLELTIGFRTWRFWNYSPSPVFLRCVKYFCVRK